MTERKVITKEDLNVVKKHFEAAEYEMLYSLAERYYSKYYSQIGTLVQRVKEMAGIEGDIDLIPSGSYKGDYYVSCRGIILGKVQHNYGNGVFDLFATSVSFIPATEFKRIPDEFLADTVSNWEEPKTNDAKEVNR